MLIQKIARELKDILGIGTAKPQSRKPGFLSGKLGDAFFEPLREEELQQWE